MNYVTGSCLSIIGRVYSMLRVQGYCTESDMIEWIGEALEHIGVGPNLVNKSVKLEVVDYKAQLPCDFYILNMIAGVSKNNNMFIANPNGTNLDFTNAFTQSSSNIGSPLVPSATPFPFQNTDSQAPNFGSFEGSAKIEFPYVKTSFEKGTVYLAYQGFDLDENGYPIVPLNVSFKEALFYYIFKCLLLRGFQHPDFNFDKAHNMWLNYCSQARNSYNMPDIPQMEALMRSWVRLIPQMRSYTEMFAPVNSENLNRTHTNFLLP